jgi:hypothetical protein
MLIAFFIVACDSGDVEYNYDYSVHTTYDLEVACTTARQSMNRVRLDDYVDIEFDGTNCVVKFPEASDER